jgi:hypothetical protein
MFGPQFLCGLQDRTGASCGFPELLKALWRFLGCFPFHKMRIFAFCANKRCAQMHGMFIYSHEHDFNCCECDL